MLGSRRRIVDRLNTSPVSKPRNKHSSSSPRKIITCNNHSFEELKSGSSKKQGRLRR